MDENEEPQPRTEWYAGLLRLPVRRTDDGWLGGVAAGLAHRMGVDPLLIRVAFIVLGLAFGIGVLAYLIAWAVVPDERDSIHLVEGAQHGQARSLVLLVVAFVALILLGVSPGQGSGGWLVLLTVAVVAVVLWSVSGRQGAPTQPPPARVEPTMAAPAPPARAARAPRRPSRRSAGSMATLVLIGAALVAAGVVALLAGSQGWPGNSLTLALAAGLAVLGLGMLGLGVAGRRTGVVGFLGVLTALTTMAATPLPADIPMSMSAGLQERRPVTASDLEGMHVSAGEMRVDLRSLDPALLDGRTVNASVAAGLLRVRVPEDWTVKTRADVELGEVLLDNGVGPTGTTTVAERTWTGGASLDHEMMLGGAPGDEADLVLDLDVAFGQIVLERY